MRSSGSREVSPVELRHAERVRFLRGIERQRRDLRALGGRQLAHAVVEAGHDDAPVRVLERSEDLRERFQRVLHDAAKVARVQVRRRAAHGDLPADQPAQRRRQRRNVFGEHGGVRHDHDVAREPLLLAREKRLEVHRADLFFAFDHDLDVDRQLAVDASGAPRSRRCASDTGPCRRPRRARTACRRAPRRRTAATSRARADRPAARRDGRRSAPSARPVRRATRRTRRGCRRSRAPRRVSPAACMRATACSAEVRTSAA